MRPTPRQLAMALGLSVGLSAGPAAVYASTLNANWYVLPFNPNLGQHVDVEVSITGTVTGLVNPTLGSSGRPVRSAASAAQPDSSAAKILDVNAANEILWWTTGTRTATRGATTFTYTVVPDTYWPSLVTLPFNQTANLFPSGGPDNANGFLAGHLFGTFVAPTGGTISLTVGADDDVWVFINNTLVLDQGGVKAFGATTSTITGLTPGTHRIDVFFADRHTVQSGLLLNANVRFNPVPEPASLALLAAGLLGLGTLARRRV